MGFFKKTLLTTLLSLPLFSGEDTGISERSLPLILEQRAEFEKSPPTPPEEIVQFTGEIDDLELPVDQCDKRRILYLMSKGQKKNGDP